MGNTFLVILCVVALPAPFLLFQDWRVHQGHVKQRPEKRSCLAIVILVLMEALSIGAFLALIGLGFGRVIITFSSYRSFGGIIGISSCFLVWFGFAGFIGGLGLALRRMTSELESEE